MSRRGSNDVTFAPGMPSKQALVYKKRAAPKEPSEFNFGPKGTLEKKKPAPPPPVSRGEQNVHSPSPVQNSKLNPVKEMQLIAKNNSVEVRVDIEKKNL